MAEKHNLQAKIITEFTTEDTVYIKNGDKLGSTTSLCQFLEYKGAYVYGTVISDEARNRVVKKAKIIDCALYGQNPNDGRAYYHWFKSSGYAIYPQDYLKGSEQADMTLKHPSYGLIGISRRSARGTSLFGSSITHNEIIAIRICKATVERQLNHEWYYDDQELIEVEMSANQFAEFITTPNQGSGVPCTIRHLLGDVTPHPPYESQRDKYSDEFAKKMQSLAIDLSTNIDIVRQILDKKSVGVADKAEVIRLFEQFTRALKESVPYIEKNFGAQMDKTVTEAKGEIEAFITRRLTEEGRKVLLGETGEFQLLQNPETNPNDETE